MLRDFVRFWPASQCGIMVTLSQAVAPRFLTVQQWGSRSGGLVGGNQGLAGLADEHLTNKLANLR